MRRTWESSGESTTFSNAKVCMISYIDVLIRSRYIHISFNLRISGLLVYAVTDYVHSGWSCYTIGYISSLTWNTCYFGWNMTCFKCTVVKTCWVLRRKLPSVLKSVEKDITLSSLQYVWICPWSPGCFVVMKRLLRTNSLATLLHSIFLKSVAFAPSPQLLKALKQAKKVVGAFSFRPWCLPVFTGISEKCSILLPVVYHLLRTSKHVQFLKYKQQNLWGASENLRPGHSVYLLQFCFLFFFF